jgi:hypothetical protein
MKILEKLMNIQSELTCPKSEFNKFGNYYHRNLESIYESLKPLLKKYKCCYTVDNEMVLVGDKIYRKGIARLSCVETGEFHVVSTMTQESIGNKGMSAEQCSGSTASYNDKYLAGKMFCIDDTKDADAINEHDKQKTENKPQPKPSVIAGDDYIFKFGKYHGRSMREVANTDKEGLKSWVIWYNKEGENKIEAKVILATFIKLFGEKK